MAFSGLDAQLKKAYESEQMTPEQIAQDLGLDVVAVKARLMQISSLYRKDCGKEPIEQEVEDGLNFTDEQLKHVNNVIYEAALEATLPDGSKDWRTRLKAAAYVRDDKKGRKEIVKAVQHTNIFNLSQINDHLQQARIQAQAARRQITDREKETALDA